MPSRVVTVTLNYNHSKRFALLLSETGVDRGRETILREARNKFRSKVSSVFISGGVILAEGEPFPELVSQVWVGKGEPYCGPPGIVHGSPSNFDSELHLISGKSYLDDKAIEQLKAVGRLPGVALAVGLPDLHPGSRYPIGCAIAVEGIYPALIGSDVGCGIALYELSARPKSINPIKLASALRGLDDPWTGSVSAWLSNYGITRVSEFDTSLGTVGAGNHFAELCSVEKIVDEPAAERLGVLAGGLYLLVHTGSRGLGSSILAGETTTESNPYIPPDSPHLQEYLTEHDYAVRWAVANRDLVAHRIKQCIMPSLEDAGEVQLNLKKIIDVTHNSVTKHALSVWDTTRELWVHRKGAAPADQGVAPCPGNRGSFSWLLRPTGDGQYNAHSLAHGAGRRYARNALHTGAKINKANLTQTDLGSVVICEDANLLIEEQPDAYKDVACVIEDMEDKGVCKGVLILRPVVTYKVRKER
ncbi:release factor H-coupled R [Mycena olivaceomarginata]|nr:release factor H-coupled R [Mycena olivaceomarginata]